MVLKNRPTQRKPSNRLKDPSNGTKHIKKPIRGKPNSQPQIGRQHSDEDIIYDQQQQPFDDPILHSNNEEDPMMDNVPYSDEEHQLDIKNGTPATWTSPEQLRLQKAKDMIQQVTKKIRKDDFFAEPLEENQPDNQDQQVHNELQTAYNKTRNKLYEDNAEVAQWSFTDKNCHKYKGHTRTITGFEITQDKMVSCAKDGSIIVWDRSTGKKNIMSYGREPDHHKGDILSISLHGNGKVAATGGIDGTVKLWDLHNCRLIDTLKGHRNHVNGVKFGINSNNLCSVSSDLTMKQWDFSQRGLIQTFYEHNAQVLDIDAISANDFLSSGNDHQCVLWRTEKETKVVFKGHDYAIDRIRAFNQQRFITACQDGSLNLWVTRRAKPVFKFTDAHPSWVAALACLAQSNVFATGACDRVVRVWKAGLDSTGISLLHQVPTEGIVTDIKLTHSEVAFTECEQLRLGRWITTKCPKSTIKIYSQAVIGRSLNQPE